MAQKQWTVEQINGLLRSYQPACVLAAAGELELFSRMAGREFSAQDAAATLSADVRGMTILLDALAALQLLEKVGHSYQIPPSLADLLDGTKPGNQLAMVQHQANCLRRWAQLASVVKTGQVPARQASVRGEAADYASFIEAMDNVSGSAAPKLVAALGQLKFQHLLDVGGGSGTWTLAFLRANSSARATIFDLQQVKQQAVDRVAAARMSDRVTFVAGDFYADELPGSADLVWLSAIVHQNSRQQNRALFKKIASTLVPGGQVLVRDFLMDETRTTPVGGALFAVNMLVATPAGGTYTIAELSDDLKAAGLAHPQVLIRDETMFSVLAATKA